MSETFKPGQSITPERTPGTLAPADSIVMPSDGTPPAKAPHAPDKVEHGTEPVVQHDPNAYKGFSYDLAR